MRAWPKDTQLVNCGASALSILWFHVFVYLPGTHRPPPLREATHSGRQGHSGTSNRLWPHPCQSIASKKGNKRRMVQINSLDQKGLQSVLIPGPGLQRPGSGGGRPLSFLAAISGKMNPAGAGGNGS